MTNGPSSATSLHAARHSAEGERTDTDECSSCVSARVDQTSFVPAHTTNSLKGGTGLALGYGLTRPSTDLDITCGSGISKEKVVDVAYALLSRDHNRKITRADVNQKGRGYVRLNWTDHEDGKEIHHETKVDVNVNDDLGGGICAVGFFRSFVPLLDHNLNIFHPISDVIPLSGKWSCRYLPESQRRNLNQGKNK